MNKFIETELNLLNGLITPTGQNAPDDIVSNPDVHSSSGIFELPEPKHEILTEPLPIQKPESIPEPRKPEYTRGPKTMLDYDFLNGIFQQPEKKTSGQASEQKPIKTLRASQPVPQEKKEKTPVPVVQTSDETYYIIKKFAAYALFTIAVLKLGN